MDINNYLNEKLEEINTILSENNEDIEDIGVLIGTTGIALFHLYYSKFKN